MIFVSAWLMGVPRLGDDAMLYVSKGVGFYSGYNHGSPLAKSFYDQLSAQSNIDEKQKNVNWRIANQALGGATFVHDVFTGLIYKFLGNAKWTFAATETTIAVAMTFCFLTFLKTFFGASAAGLAMMILAFLLLPGQGIHYLIPSTLALSLGLLAMGTIIENRGAWPRLLLLSFLLSFLHNIGYVWLCIAFAAGVLELREPRKRWRDLCKLGAIIFSPILLKTALVWNVEFFSQPYAALAPPSLGLPSVFMDNLSAFFNHLAQRELFFTSYLELAIGFSGYRFLRGKLNARQKALIGLFLLALSLAFSVYLPAHPGEVAFRVFTALNIPLAGILAGAFIDIHQTAPPLMKRLLKTGLTGFIIFSAYHFNEYVFANIRPFVIHDNEYRETMAKLNPAEDSLLFLETEYCFRQSVINQDEKFPSYQWPLLSSQESGPAFISKKRPNVLILPVTESLNTANLSPRGRFIAREVGLASAVVSRAVVDLGGQADEPVQFYIKNRGRDAAFSLSMGNTLKTIRVPAGSESRIEIAPDRNNIIELKFEPGSRVWLSGIKRSNRSAVATSWPWGENIKLEYKFHPGGPAESRKIDFGLESLLKEWGGARLAKSLKSFQPLSDASGIIIAKVEWK